MPRRLLVLSQKRAESLASPPADAAPNCTSPGVDAKVLTVATPADTASSITPLASAPIFCAVVEVEPETIAPCSVILGVAPPLLNRGGLAVTLVTPPEPELHGAPVPASSPVLSNC